MKNKNILAEIILKKLYIQCCLVCKEVSINYAPKPNKQKEITLLVWLKTMVRNIPSRHTPLALERYRR